MASVARVGIGMIFYGLTCFVWSSLFAEGPWATGGFGFQAIFVFVLGLFLLIPSLFEFAQEAVRGFRRAPTEPTTPTEPTEPIEPTTPTEPTPEERRRGFPAVLEEYAQGLTNNLLVGDDQPLFIHDVPGQNKIGRLRVLHEILKDINSDLMQQKFKHIEDISGFTEDLTVIGTIDALRKVLEEVDNLLGQEGTAERIGSLVEPYTERLNSDINGPVRRIIAHLKNEYQGLTGSELAISERETPAQ